jgi:hypothetical protein
MGLLLVALAGCADPDATDDVLWAPRGVAKADGPMGPSSAGPQVVYVAFEGARIEDCPFPCSRAANNQSWAIQAGFGRAGSMEFAPYENTAGRKVILDRLAALFARYRVSFTSERPAAEPYTMVIISPTVAAHHGMAPMDCGNQNQNDIAFVYHIAGIAPDQIARFAAHELGHSFGLSHVVETSEIMQWASSGRAFGTGTYDPAHPSDKCFQGDVQDADALLLSALGSSS